VSEEPKLSGGALWNYKRSRELEGTFPNDDGCFIITAQRVLFGWGQILDEHWPNPRLNGPEPEGLDEFAKRRRVNLYYRVLSFADLRAAISAGSPVGAAFSVSADWFDAPNGDIDVSDAEPIGTHAITLLGYDDTKQRVTFVNSWGERWGNKGLGTLSYEFIQQNIQEAWTFDGFLGPPPWRDGDTLINWGLPSPVGLIHGIEIVDPKRDDRTAWALLRETGDDRFWIEDIFVKPDARGGGLGSQLVARILELENHTGLQLTGARISSVDAEMHLAAIERLAGQLGLSIEPFDDPQSAYVAVRS